MIVQESSNWHKLIHWRSKGTSRTGDHCSFVSSFPLEQRQIKATRRKEKKAEDCTDGAKWAQTEITSDFNSWEMRWHQRNLICVIHNRKIGRNAASDRYSIFNMTVSFRSFQFFGATLCSTATSKINLYRLCDGIDPGFCRWFYAFDPRSQGSDPRSHPFDPWSHMPRYDSVIIF